MFRAFATMTSAYWRSLSVQRNLERSAVAFLLLVQRQDELPPADERHDVAVVADLALAALRIRKLRVDDVGQRIVEIDLRREFLAARPFALLTEADLEVHVHRSARIPAGKDRGE